MDDTDLNPFARSIYGCADAVAALAESCARAAESLQLFVDVCEANREHWLLTGSVWPEKPALLNRYVRTGIEPPYLLDDVPFSLEELEQIESDGILDAEFIG